MHCCICADKAGLPHAVVCRTCKEADVALLALVDFGFDFGFDFGEMHLKLLLTVDFGFDLGEYTSCCC